jgi:hypothetical protein
MHSLLLAALFLPAWLGPRIGLRAGPTIEVHPATYTFGREMLFTASVHSSDAVVGARLILRDGFSQSVTYPAQITVSEGSLLSVRRDLVSEPLFPFSWLTYWWEADFSSGEKTESDQQTVQYSDDRFVWKRLEKGRATVEWVEGESKAAEDAAGLMLLALGTESGELEAPIPERVFLYIYPRLADFYTAADGLVRGWEGAVSDPASGIILLAAASDAEGRRSLAVLIPHEIAHVLLGAKWGSAYASLPLWLVEGLAAGYEMEPRPEADLALQEAVDAGRVIPIPALCGVFPAEEAPALLAYAESKSFMAFVKKKYGLAAIRIAMTAYSGGAECSQGIEKSTGKKLVQLESEWREGLAGNKIWISPSWVLVLAGCCLLAGVLTVRWLFHKKILRLPAGRERLR